MVKYCIEAKVWWRLTRGPPLDQWSNIKPVVKYQRRGETPTSILTVAPFDEGPSIRPVVKYWMPSILLVVKCCSWCGGRQAVEYQTSSQMLDQWSNIGQVVKYLLVVKCCSWCGGV